MTSAQNKGEKRSRQRTTTTFEKLRTMRTTTPRRNRHMSYGTFFFSRRCANVWLMRFSTLSLWIAYASNSSLVTWSEALPMIGIFVKMNRQFHSVMQKQRPPPWRRLRQTTMLAHTTTCLSDVLSSFPRQWYLYGQCQLRDLRNCFYVKLSIDPSHHTSLQQLEIQDAEVVVFFQNFI